MRKTALATILLAAGMALAQTSATPSTVQGCLSGASGSYTFTDQSGKSWTLTGSTDNLKDHVGNTVEITGNEDTTNNTISISDVKDISQGCNQTATSSMGQTSATAAGTESTATQPSSTSGMESSSAAAGTQSNTTAGTQPDYAPEGAQSTPNAQTPAQDQSTANPQEPNTEPGQTATPSSTSQTGTGNAVQGCLAGSMGSFTITDQSGKTWTLTGNSDELQKHVGNTVQITGAQDTTNNSITVSNVTDVSQGCQQGAAGISNQQTGTTEATGTTGTQPSAVSPATPTTTAEVTQPGTNPEEAPGTNSQDIRKNPAQSDIPSAQPQIDATNNPPTFGTEQNATTQTSQSQQTTTTAAAPSSSTSATTTEQQPSATEQNPGMTAQSTEPATTEQPSAEPSTSATTTEQSGQAATEQSEPTATEQTDQANQPATASENANQNATTEQGTAAANRGQLPQTASPLPLLLLLGFGSLAGAFFAFRRVKA